jgi:genome maintenance exonuclease 1
MKTFIDYELPEIKRIDSNGKRQYLTPDGKSYPSVTTIIGLLSRDSKTLQNWKKRVGEKEANRITRKAANRGTRIHTLCENYFKGNDINCSLPDQEVWNQFKKELDNVDNIHALETPLFSNNLKIAGTVDCIAEYKNNLSIIDFKTAKRLKKEENIAGYFMQCAAYSMCFFEMTKIPINNMAIIIGVDDQFNPQVFQQPCVPWIKEFKKLRKQYYEEYGV